MALSAARLAAPSVAAVAALLAFDVVRRQHKKRDEAATVARELQELLAQLKALNKTAFLVVTNSAGDAFAEKALASYAKKKCGSSAGSVLADARRLVAKLAAPAPPRASDFGPGNAARRLKHALVRGAVSPTLLADKFPAVKAAYVQQALDYGRHSRYGDRWKISCYLVVLEKWKPKIMPHAPMVDAMGDVMELCRIRFEAWYAERFGLTRCDAAVMNCFLTRYRPMPDERELQKHIDGANVDGSVILALPTDAPFAGGGLKVWDGGKPPAEHDYAMKPGDCIFLDARVWHQGCPITTGERYALVLFLKLAKTP